MGEACWSWTWPFFSGSSHAPLAVLSTPTIRRQFPPGPRQQAFPAATTMPTSTHKHFCHDRLPAARTNVAGYYFGSGKTTSNDRRGLPYVANLWPHVLTFLSSFVSPTLILYLANFDSFPPPSSTSHTKDDYWIACLVLLSRVPQFDDILLLRLPDRAILARARPQYLQNAYQQFLAKEKQTLRTLDAILQQHNFDGLRQSITVPFLHTDSEPAVPPFQFQRRVRRK